MRVEIVSTGLPKHPSGVEDRLQRIRPLSIHDPSPILLHRSHIEEKGADLLDGGVLDPSSDETPHRVQLRWDHALSLRAHTPYGSGHVRP